MIEPPHESFRIVVEEQRYALHDIDDPTNLSFDRYAYSRYKYGDTNQARIFGEELSQGFLDKHGEFLLSSSQSFLALSSPRARIPPAAYFIFQTFLEQLNRFCQIHHRPPILEHTIQRLGTIAEDYSTLSEHERFDHLIHERYSIDSQSLNNKYLLFLDDIRITGMHERNIIRLLENSAISNRRFFIYYAQLINEHIPSSFEYQLNRCAIGNLPQLLTIINNPLSIFQINTRILKEILRSNASELNEFLQSISVELLSQIYHACLACQYQTMDAFTGTFRQLYCIYEQRRTNLSHPHQ